jgi:peptidyl-tRNA hydrolase
MSANIEDARPADALVIEHGPDETGDEAAARILLEPHLRHGLSASAFARQVFGKACEQPGLMDYVNHMRNVTGAADVGDLTMVSGLLAAQAVTLDAMFTELARRSANNITKHVDAAERYGRLALKAQANSRATLEALVKLHQPREQTVRHVHVNEGGQAVIADHFHNHRGEAENGKSDEQSHATGQSGTSAALPRPDANGNGMPVASRKRSE